MLPPSSLATYKTMATIALVASLAVALLVQSGRLTITKAELALRDEQVASMRTSLLAQNAGIAALRADTERKEQAARFAARAANSALAAAADKVRAIERAQVPDDCEGAMQWLVDEGRRLEGGTQ